jgi:hypothetical protein
MKQLLISQKFFLSANELILSFISGSTASVFEDSEKITNTYRPELSKLQEIKYFHLADTIKAFSSIQPNWDSYNADKISKSAIDTAIETLNYLNSKGLLSNGIKINVFPMRDGGIQFEFDGETICAELEINQNGDLTFILFDNDANIVDKKQLFELSELSSLLEEAQYERI